MTDPEDVFGERLSGLLPRPVPFAFRFLDPEERGWRGRAAIRFWLLGYPVRSAWLFAMSRDPGWSDYRAHQHLDMVDDRRLPGDVVGRRLWDVVEAEDWYQRLKAEMAADPAPPEPESEARVVFRSR